MAEVGQEVEAQVRRLAPGSDLLLVLRCDGQRCRALRALAGDQEPDREDLVRAAVAGRSRTVLVSTPCLGPCAAGSVLAVGRGCTTPTGLSWTARPTWLAQTETRANEVAAAVWVSDGAPDPSCLPEGLAVDRREHRPGPTENADRPDDDEEPA